MDGGRVIETGDVFDVFSDPQNASSRRFVSTVVKGVPSPAELAVLRERHAGRIVTLSFRDGDAAQAARLPRARERAGVAFELVYGGINDIQGRAFGHLTLALRGDDAAIDAALARIGAEHARDGGALMDALIELLPEFWKAAGETLYMVVAHPALRRRSPGC